MRPAADPEAALAVLEEGGHGARGHSPAARRPSIERHHTVGANPYESLCRAEPDVRITIPQHAKHVERAERGRHAFDRRPASVPPPDSPECGNPETSIGRGADGLDGVVCQIVRAGRDTAVDNGEQSAA